MNNETLRTQPHMSRLGYQRPQWTQDRDNGFRNNAESILHHLFTPLCGGSCGRGPGSAALGRADAGCSRQRLEDENGVERGVEIGVEYDGAETDGVEIENASEVETSGDGGGRGD